MREILMTVQGYSKWGFDVYRTSFEDDALFQRHTDYIRKAMIRRCEDDGAGDVASAATLYPKEEQGGKHLTKTYHLTRCENSTWNGSQP